MKQSFQKIMLIVFLGLIVYSSAENEFSNENEDSPILTLTKLENLFGEFSELPHENKKKLIFRKLNPSAKEALLNDNKVKLEAAKLPEGVNSENKVPVAKVSNSKPLVEEKKPVEIASSLKSSINSNVSDKNTSNITAQKQDQIKEDNKNKTEIQANKVVESTKNLKIEKPAEKVKPAYQVNESEKVQRKEKVILKEKVKIQNTAAPENTNNVNVPVQSENNKKKTNKIKIEANANADAEKSNSEADNNNETVLSFETDSNVDKKEIKNNRKSNTVYKIDALDDDVAKLKQLTNLEPVVYVKELSDTGAAYMRDDT
jgi:hypothetical protein